MAQPERVVLGDARLCLARAWTSFADGALDEVLPCLETAEAAPVPGPLLDGTTSVASGAATLRASYWLRVGDFGKTVTYAREALMLEHGRGERSRPTASAPPSIGSTRRRRRASSSRRRSRWGVSCFPWWPCSRSVCWR